MTRRVLIVEDNDLNRDLLVQIFEDAYELELAADGEAAVAAAGRADLILMDIALPGLSGLEAVAEIRAGGAGLPIVAISSSVMPGDRERAIDAGCDEFIAKPIEDAALVQLVARLLERT